MSATESVTQSYTVKISTNYKEFPNLEIGYNALLNRYSGTTFYTDKPFARIDYLFFKQLCFCN